MNKTYKITTLFIPKIGINKSENIVSKTPLKNCICKFSFSKPDIIIKVPELHETNESNPHASIKNK